MLVLDASLVVPTCAAGVGFGFLGDSDLIAPPIMWSEARSTLHAALWRGELSAPHAWTSHERLNKAPIAVRSPSRLGEEAWRVADELGWARTYDAEYVALARLLGCRLVTVDARLRRGADRTGLVVAPDEL
ncbi:MAG: type II toxin-antitoxin system VapC family toxin [Gaiellaceae bacterium]